MGLMTLPYCKPQEARWGAGNKGRNKAIGHILMYGLPTYYTQRLICSMQAFGARMERAKTFSQSFKKCPKR